MNSGINSCKDFAEFVSYIVIIISLFGLWVSYLLSKRQIHFSVMEKCIRDFRDFEKSASKLSELNRAKQYIELINEEFFYLENNYLPVVVSIEWIDGMIDYLPFILGNGKFIKSNDLKELDSIEKTNKLLKNYPRVRKVIQINTSINFEWIHLAVDDESKRQLRQKERDKLIFSMITNLKNGYVTRLRLKKTISSR
jgi:hypothetical protein